jgi:hypothetical protein
MKKWNFAPEPLTLDVGERKFPVSYLFEGKLPATTHSHLCMIDYHFIVNVKTKDGHDIRFSKTIELRRAIHPGNDRNSVRVFPPTNVTANLTHNPVIYETGDIPIVLKLDGMARTEKANQLRWRMRRLVWRIEESEKIVSNPCPKHVDKVPAGSSGIQHEYTRIIGEAELDRVKTPWKTDLSAGEVYCEFTAQLNATRKATHDESTPERGILISHALILEMVVVEEAAPLRRLNQGVPTGVARVLRATFPLTLTERAGLGVAWDEETPPVYQDVPPSPPRYHNTSADTVALDELANEPGFEDLRLGEPLDPARATAVRASASVVVGRSSEDEPRPGSANILRLSADDLLSEPPEYFRRPEEGEQEDVDVQVGSLASR